MLGPATLSILCHAAILLTFAGVTWAVGAAGHGGNALTYDASIVTGEPGETSSDYLFGAQETLASNLPAQGSTQFNTRNDLASLLEAEQDVSIERAGDSRPGLEGGGLSELSRADVIGTGTGGGGSGGSGTGLGQRDLGAGGPVGSLWGVGKGQRARSIVYVMDRSGSMSDTFSLLQRELRKAIGSLEQDQLFTVIWFNEGAATEWSARMRPATLDTKREAFDAIRRVVPSGRTEPMDALRKGLAHQSDVLFLLSDGDFGEENDRIVKLIAQRNRNKRTVINTILFVYDTMGDGERVLRSIAQNNRGTYKHVTEQDIRF